MMAFVATPSAAATPASRGLAPVPTSRPQHAEAPGASAPPRFSAAGCVGAAGALAAFGVARSSKRSAKAKRHATLNKGPINYYTTSGSVWTFTTKNGPDFQFDETVVLGVGAQGKVHPGKNMATGEEVAVKVMPVKHLILDEAGAAKMRLIDAEIAVQKAVGKHPNICQLIAGGNIYRKGTSDYPQAKVLVCEIVTGKELAQHLAEHGPLAESVAQGVIKKILAGLQHMHKQGILHRDLKAQNILITGDRITPDSEVKLIDFGVAKNTGDAFFKTLVGTLEIMPPEMAACKCSYIPASAGERKMHSAKFKPPWDEDPGFGFVQRTQEGYGARLNDVNPQGPAYKQGIRDDWALTMINDINVETMLFQANADDSSHAKKPKIVNTLMEIGGDFTIEVAEAPTRAFTAKVDMWAVGVNLYMCLTGKVPFSSELQIIEGDYNKDLLASCSAEARALIAGLLEKDPEKRLSLAQCLAHPWAA